jgi:hypothetical protein
MRAAVRNGQQHYCIDSLAAAQAAVMVDVHVQSEHMQWNSGSRSSSQLLCLLQK